VALIAAFTVAGCKQGREYKQQEDVLAYGPDVEKIVMADYAAQAIGVTGGIRAWVEVKKLQLDCVVTFYELDGSFYLTEQHHEVYPWSSSIKILTREPQGNLSGRHFSELEKVAILYMIAAPALLLDESAEFAKGPDPIKREGLWYYPIERVSSPNDAPELAKVVFYQSRDSSLVDVLWLVGIGGEKSLAVRCYDYREVEKMGVWVPTKIEIFRADAKGVFQERLIRIDFK
jgi:hypothetical protein